MSTKRPSSSQTLLCPNAGVDLLREGNWPRWELSFGFWKVKAQSLLPLQVVLLG